MSGKQEVTQHHLRESARNDLVSTASVLAVGEPDQWKQQGNAFPSSGVTFVAFHEVTESTLNEINPSMVYSPVLAPTFDCIELALLLHNLGYTGAYRAMAKDLPRPALIEREVKQICPRVDFRIMMVNE